MVATAMQGVDQHIRNNFGFSILTQDTLTCRPGEPNQQLSDNKELDLPLSLYSRIKLTLNYDVVKNHYEQ